ncbi:DUF7059 domain-containing protein [Tessaracoccus sp. Z1128]
MPLDASALRARLVAADFTVDAVLGRIGEAGQDGLGRNSTVPADVALGEASDPLSTLIRLFVLQQPVDADQLAEAVDVSAMQAAGYLETLTGGRMRALVDIRPYGSPDDGASGWIVADPTPGMDGETAPTRPDYVLGVSPASSTLAQITPRERVGSALDLGTGCGVQSLHLARHASRVVATDVNPRALELARLTAELNGVALDLRAGSLYDPVQGERFDLIVSNPPFVMSPPTHEADTLTYREANFEGDSLVETLVRGAADHLTPGGSLQLLTNWAILDQPWEDRLRGWIPAGCDAWVIERERLDIFSYIEMWLTDAGLVGSPRWRGAYDEWLRYFDRLGVRAVGMGWILVTRAGRDEPHLRLETWPHAVAQPVGAVFGRHAGAVTAATLALRELLATRPRLVDVDQEAIGRPGAEDPEHIVFRQSVGLRRAIKADTALAAVLGALDGDLTVAQVLGAVAQVLQTDASDLAAAVVPELRTALLTQMLRIGQ